MATAVKCRYCGTNAATSTHAKMGKTKRASVFLQLAGAFLILAGVGTWTNGGSLLVIIGTGLLLWGGIGIG